MNEVEFKYGIVVLEGTLVHHICLYPNEPTIDDCHGLLGELKTDPELGMVGSDFTKMDFCSATGVLLKTAMDALRVG